MKIKKLLLMITFLSILIIAFEVNSFAATGTVNVDAVMVRKSYSKDSKALDTAYKGEQVTIIGEKDNWYKVKYKDNEGYIYGKYLDVSGEIEEQKQTEEINKQENTTTETNSTNVISINLGETYKTIKDTKLHIIPVIYSSIIQELNKGESVKIIQVTNNWAYVDTDKYIGWITIASIFENYSSIVYEEPTPTPIPTPTPTPTEEKQEEQQPVVEPEQTKTEEKQQETPPVEEQVETAINNKVGYVNVESAFVRTGPSVDYDDITTINLNTEVQILGEKNKWYHIKVDNIEGYINKKLVSDEKVKTTSRSLTESRTNLSDKVDEEDEEEQVVETQATTKGVEIVDYAKQFLGGQYVSGGNNPKTGVDCSGFTKYVYEHFGYTLSRTTSGQAENGKNVAKSEMQEGDLIIFLNDSKTEIGHVGIYIGNNEFIHAANAKRGIVIDSVDNSYYKPRFVCARRII